MVTHKGFHFVVLFAALLVFLCAGLVTISERNARGANIHEFGQGLWWAIVTVTTVGYGGRYPVTPMGQGIAVVLMLAGIGLIGALTATVASYFVEQKSDEAEDRLDRIEALLEILVERGVSGGLSTLSGLSTLNGTANGSGDGSASAQRNGEPSRSDHEGRGAARLVATAVTESAG